MILIDTNVVSEPMRVHPDRRVIDWLDRQSAETLFLSTISLAELLLGLAVLPAGRRRDALAHTLESRITALFGNRILGFDTAAAHAYATAVAHARQRGHQLSVADGQIAAIASVHGLSVASRDEAPFQAAGVGVVNPWTAPA